MDNTNRSVANSGAAPFVRQFLWLACLFGGSATLLGAFGAHALKDVLSAYQLQIYETGIRYQFYHTFALVAAAWWGGWGNPRRARMAGWLFVAGILCFSGSLYLLALREVLGIPDVGKYVGWITPLGGTLFVAGWGALLLGAGGGNRQA